MPLVSRTKRGGHVAEPVQRGIVSRLELPRANGEIETDISKFIHLVSGDRKIGKSSLFKEFEDPFFIFCEPGGISISSKKVNISSWEDFKKIVYLLESEPDYCRTVIIDTGYMAYEWCYDFCLRSMNLTSPRDEAWGTAWKFIEREFRTEQMKILNAGFGLGVTAHTEMKTLKTRQGVEYEKLTVQLGGQATKFYNAFADIIVHIQYDERGERELVIRGDNTVEAGTRTSQNFLYTDGSRIKSIPFDFTDESIPEKSAYKRYNDAFYNKLVKPQTTVKTSSVDGGLPRVSRKPRS